jgi:hypothetical protein
MPLMKDRAEKGVISQTRTLYSQLISQSRRLAQRNQRAARRRGPVAKALLSVCFVAVLIAALTLIYGFIVFPDAPMRQTASGYVGKHGAAHTRDDYEQFMLWEKLVVASFGLALLTGLSAVFAEKINQRV